MKFPQASINKDFSQDHVVSAVDSAQSWYINYEFHLLVIDPTDW